MNNRLRQLGLTPAKGALIGLLVVGLLVVWGPTVAKLVKFNKAQPLADAAEPSAGPSVRPAVATPPAKANRPTNQRRDMPEIGLAEATGLDPFEIPAWSPSAKTDVEKIVAAEEDSVKAKFEALSQTGVAMVLVSGGEQVVQINGKTLRVGDEVQGFRIVEINDSGVVFEPVNPREQSRGA